MKVRIELEPEENPEEAAETLYKALRAKKLIKNYAKESYNDKVLDSFHDYIMEEYVKVIKEIEENLQNSLKYHLKVFNVNQ